MIQSLLLGILTTRAHAANWAVLAAGSQYYSNYRHQADVCHAYTIVKSKGIPEENIILMMYDDVAHSPDNPFPGQLFNAPRGIDVYAICGPAIDYRGDDITPDTFVGVLTGEGSGKVLGSTENDDVFVYFVDHGGPGLIAFPNDVLHQVDLVSALQKMSDAKMFKKLVFYLETCDSGSMFLNMSIPGVYAVTAAGPNEPSWGTFCGQDAIVSGTSMGTCLGDLFSVTWMRNARLADITTETLAEQYSFVSERVTKSVVSTWGDQSFADDPVSDFLGNSQQLSQMSALEGSSVEEGTTSYSATQLELRRHVFNYEDAPTSHARLLEGLKLHDKIKKQVLVEHAYRRLAVIAYPGSQESQSLLRQRQEQPVNRDCELAGHRAMRQQCAGLFNAGSTFALGFHQVVVNLCHDVVNRVLILDVATAVQMACEHIENQPQESLFGLAAMQAASGLLV